MRTNSPLPGQIIPGELWRSKDAIDKDPEIVKFMVIMAIGRKHVVVDVFGKGLHTCSKEDFVRHYERDIEEGMKSSFSIVSLRKWFDRFLETRCKHQYPIFEKRFRINQECKQCFPEPTTS